MPRLLVRYTFVCLWKHFQKGLSQETDSVRGRGGPPQARVQNKTEKGKRQMDEYHNPHLLCLPMHPHVSAAGHELVITAVPSTHRQAASTTVEHILKLWSKSSFLKVAPCWVFSHRTEHCDHQTPRPQRWGEREALLREDPRGSPRRVTRNLGKQKEQLSPLKSLPTKL